MGVDVTIVPLKQLCLVERGRGSGEVVSTALMGCCRVSAVGRLTVIIPLPVSKYVENILHMS